MKTKHIISLTLMSLMLLPISCMKPDMTTGRQDNVKGLLNVTIKIPDTSTECEPEKQGPYEEGEEILIKVPTTEEDPLDLTRLYCQVSVENDCRVDPPLSGLCDFSEPKEIIVYDALGNRHSNTVRVIPTLPKTTFRMSWMKNSIELGAAGRDITGVALSDKYMVIQEYMGKMYLYDLETAKLIRTTESANTQMMKITSDDAGHFITARENINDAGYMVYLYDIEKDQHRLILDWKRAEGAPIQLFDISVIGDITKGKAYLYASGTKTLETYYWEFKDGKAVTPAGKPNILKYQPARKEWDYAQIQRASLDDNSDHYINFHQQLESKDVGGSNFHIFSPELNINVLKPENHLYKILDFKVIDLEDDKYLITNEQGYNAWDESHINVFDITNRGMMELKPGDVKYDKFRLFRGEDIWVINYNKWGDLAVSKVETASGYDVYIAALIVGFTPETSFVRMYKMSYYRQ